MARTQFRKAQPGRWVLGCRKLELSGSDLFGSSRMEVCGVGAMHCLTARCRGGGTTMTAFDSFLELGSGILAPGRDWGTWAMGSRSGAGNRGCRRQVETG